MVTDAQPSRTHRRDFGGGIGVWEVGRLIELAAALPVVALPVSALRAEFERVYWFGGDVLPTVAAVVDHSRRIAEADLSRPIIVSSTGAVMDGMHRVAKALLDGHDTIPAVVFLQDPPPDRIEPA